MDDDIEDDWDGELERERYSDEDNDLERLPCSACGDTTIGDSCQCCGAPLCPACFERRGGFCKRFTESGGKVGCVYDDGMIEMEESA